MFNGQFYRQLHGVLLTGTAPHPPHWWYMYVDDIRTDFRNTLDPNTKFTTLGKKEGAVAFLDTNSVRKEDSSLKVTIYRKEMHTGQYLIFELDHPLEHKLGVV